MLRTEPNLAAEASLQPQRVLNKDQPTIQVPCFITCPGIGKWLLVLGPYCLAAWKCFQDALLRLLSLYLPMDIFSHLIENFLKRNSWVPLNTFRFNHRVHAHDVQNLGLFSYCCDNIVWQEERVYLAHSPSQKGSHNDQSLKQLVQVSLPSEEESNACMLPPISFSSVVGMSHLGNNPSHSQDKAFPHGSA